MRHLMGLILLGALLGPPLAASAQDPQLSMRTLKQNARDAGYPDLVMAAEQGSWLAAFDLGSLYFIGGRSPDSVQAYVWFGIASVYGEGKGCVNVGEDFRAMAAYDLTQDQIAQAGSLVDAWLAEHDEAVAIARAHDVACGP